MVACRKANTIGTDDVNDDVDSAIKETKKLNDKELNDALVNDKKEDQ